VVDPALQKNREQIFFGATVTYENSRGEEHEITIVGIDEADLDKGQVSWVSPIAKALLKAREGDVVELRTPAGPEQIEVVAIRSTDCRCPPREPANENAPKETLRGVSIGRFAKLSCWRRVPSPVRPRCISDACGAAPSRHGRPRAWRS